MGKRTASTPDQLRLGIGDLCEEDVLLLIDGLDRLIEKRAAGLGGRRAAASGGRSCRPPAASAGLADWAPPPTGAKHRAPR
jgi:hypothetical protein